MIRYNLDSSKIQTNRLPNIKVKRGFHLSVEKGVVLHYYAAYTSVLKITRATFSSNQK